MGPTNLQLRTQLLKELQWCELKAKEYRQAQAAVHPLTAERVRLGQLAWSFERRCLKIREKLVAIGPTVAGELYLVARKRGK